MRACSHPVCDKTLMLAATRCVRHMPARRHPLPATSTAGLLTNTTNTYVCTLCAYGEMHLLNNSVSLTVLSAFSHVQVWKRPEHYIMLVRWTVRDWQRLPMYGAHFFWLARCICVCSRVCYVWILSDQCMPDPSVP
jgi:hypothetical protein